MFPNVTFDLNEVTEIDITVRAPYEIFVKPERAIIINIHHHFGENSIHDASIALSSKCGFRLLTLLCHLWPLFAF